MIKLSNLKNNEMIMVDEEVIEVEEIKNHLEDYKYSKIYSTIKINPIFNAKMIIEDAVYENGEMYVGWGERFINDVREKDIQDIQNIFDRMIERNLTQNVAYLQGKEIENDLLEDLE